MAKEDYLYRIHYTVEETARFKNKRALNEFLKKLPSNARIQGVFMEDKKKPYINSLQLVLHKGKMKLL